MKKILLLNKKEGETPLETLGRFRKKNINYKDVKMTYAGRLDPMASGLLLVLTGMEVKKKEKYLALTKEYDFEILFGAASDTQDILGKVLDTKWANIDKTDLKEKITDNLKYFIGKFTQKYPLYSSPSIKKVRRGEMVEPKSREVRVKSLKLLSMRSIGSKKLLATIEKRIGKVKGDFRQAEILKLWRVTLLDKENTLWLARFSIECGSGTYVRSIADSLGKKLGVPALAYSIKRTKIGKWWQEEV